MIPMIATGDESPQILTSIKPLALITQELVVGTNLKVEYLLPPNVSEHGYALKISDVKRLKRASLVVWLDPDLEPYLQSSRSGWLSDEQPEKSLPLLARINIKSTLIENEDTGFGRLHSNTDPHIWLNPLLAQEIAKQIADRLAEIRPKDRTIFEDNLKMFQQKSEILDKKITKALETFREKPFIVYHQAYGYFVGHYGLNQIAALHVQPGAVMSLKQMGRVQSLIDKQSQTVCLFREPQFATTSIPVLSARHTVKTGELDPLGIHAETYNELIENVTKGFLGCFDQN